MNFLKGTNIMHKRQTEGVVGVTPEDMGHHILQSVKLTLNARIDMI